MSTISIQNSNQFIELKSPVLNNHIIHYKYLIVDNIYELAKMAKNYSFYNTSYCSIGTKSLAKEIHDNNDKIISKLPEKLVDFIRETTKMFDSITITNDLRINKNNLTKLSKTLCFSLVSKKLLNDNSCLKIFIPFSNIKLLEKYGEMYIAEMIGDIIDIVFKHIYFTNIVWPITIFDKEIDCFTLKAYEIAGIVPQHFNKKIFEEKMKNAILNE